MPFLSSPQAALAFGRPAPRVQQSAAPTTTAALYYEPTNTSSYPGSGTTVNNVGTGGTMAGTMYNVTYTSTGGGYFTFNGSSSSIRFGSYNFGTTVTISAWINATSKYSINTLLANAAANTATNGFKVHWNSWNTTNNYMLIEAGNGTSGGASTSGTAVVVPGTWQHLTWVWDVTNRTISYYNNGTLIATTTASGPPSNPNMNQAWDIGYMKGSYLMNARLGYLKVWSSLLSITDIQADYNASKARFGL